MSWNIDLAHSEVNFSVRHMMLSKVRGQFEKFSGVIEFDPKNPADTRVDVTIEAASLNTREPQRDAHLKSADFLKVDEFPTLSFKSTRVEVLDERRARLTGDLTIRSLTRPVTLEVEYIGQSKSPWGSLNAGFSAVTRISRKDWDLTWNVALETGGWLVGDEIEINVELEIVKVADSVAV